MKPLLFLYYSYMYCIIKSPSRQDEESENDLIRQIYNVVAQRCGNRHSADAVNQDGRMTLTAKLEFIKEYCVAAAANNLLVPPPNAGN